MSAKSHSPQHTEGPAPCATETLYRQNLVSRGLGTWGRWYSGKKRIGTVRTNHPLLRLHTEHQHR